MRRNLQRFASAVLLFRGDRNGPAPFVVFRSADSCDIVDVFKTDIFRFFRRLFQNRYVVYIEFRSVRVIRRGVSVKYGDFRKIQRRFRLLNHFHADAHFRPLFRGQLHLGIYRLVCVERFVAHHQSKAVDGLIGSVVHPHRHRSRLGKIPQQIAVSLENNARPRTVFRVRRDFQRAAARTIKRMIDLTGPTPRIRIGAAGVGKIRLVVERADFALPSNGNIAFFRHFFAVLFRRNGHFVLTAFRSHERLHGHFRPGRRNESVRNGDHVFHPVHSTCGGKIYSFAEFVYFRRRHKRKIDQRRIIVCARADHFAPDIRI